MVGLVLIALKIVLKNGKDLRREYFDIFSLPDDRQRKSIYFTFITNVKSISIFSIQQSEQKNEHEMTTRATTMEDQANNFDLDPDLSWEDFINKTS